MIRAQWRIGADHHAFEAITVDPDDGGTSRTLAIELFVASLDLEIGIERRAKELAGRET